MFNTPSITKNNSERLLRQFLGAAFRGALILMAAATSLAYGACTPFAQPVRYVGPLGAGSQCTDATIQDAINNSTCAYGTTIYLSPYGLSGTRTYSNQHLTINNKIVTLIGESGTYGCGSPPPYCGEIGSDPNNCLNVTAPVITLDGNNTTGSVIQVTGNSAVALKYLEIKRGNKNGSGGGISFLGSGNLSLLNSSVLSNQATYGGGIDVETSGGDLTLNLYDNVTIGTNTASESGGGLRLQGNANTATLNASSPKLFIANNEATNRYGGGVEIVGKVIANIGSPGVAGFGTIALNRAARGGGIAVLAGQYDRNAQPTLNLFSTDASNPIRVTGNSATYTGGGIFVKAEIIPSFTLGATANLWDFQIDNNIAQNGTAIYVDVYDDPLQLPGAARGVTVNLNSGARPPGSVMCLESARCNAISNNTAQNSNAIRTPGSAILIQNVGRLFANRFRMEKNSAAHAIHGISADRLIVTNCLIADNDLSAISVLRNDDADGLTQVKLKGCTIANNSIAGNAAGTHIVDIGGGGQDLEIFGNIFAQPSSNTNTVKHIGATITSTFNLAREITTLGGAISGNIAGAAVFNDPTGGDYHLYEYSLGIDTAPSLGGDDLAGKPRDIDIGSVPNGAGTRDLGAFERPCGGYVAGALCSLDIDGDDAANRTDGIMMVRRLLGFSVGSLRGDIPIGACPARRSVVAIQSLVQDQITPKAALGNLAAWDIDGNGQVDALTDGLLVLRALLGLTGTNVTNGALGNNNPARANWNSIKSYLNTTCGMTLP